MAKAKRTARKPARARKTSARNGGSTDAIALLKADHRQVEKWFEEFESARGGERKSGLAQRICQALEVHTEIEHEIFYPNFLEVTGEKDIHHEAEVEHEGAKKLIAEIEKSGPEDEYYDAKVTVLSEMIKHHVKEEEKPGGMFAKARESRMDLQALGEQLAARKAELMGRENPSSEGPGFGSGTSASQRKMRHESRATPK